MLVEFLFLENLLVLAEAKRIEESLHENIRARGVPLACECLLMSAHPPKRSVGRGGWRRCFFRGEVADTRRETCESVRTKPYG